ncbi:MAG: right-handed parallel beta-helix repeat-containing protein [Fimbriimonadaceae bacterium]|nr:right-handed parallel beta-helix repeat-containing protein [Fimbriimonadaceae bacterium]
MRRALLILLLLRPGGAAELLVDQAAPTASEAGPGTAAQPFRSVARAVAVARPGDTVLVRPGVYRESVVLRSGGAPGQPLTLRASGPGVVLSGADRVTDWQPCAAAHPLQAKLRQAALAWQPPVLLAGDHPLRLAREPDAGWFVAAGGGTNTLLDPPHLGTGNLAGGSLFFWDVDITAQLTRRIVAHDATKGELQLDGGIYRDRTVEANVDRYRVQNRLELIDEPGEWAVVDGTLYLYPPVGWDPATTPVEAARRDRFVLDWGASQQVVIEGFEVRGGASHGIGSWSGQPQGITVRRCWVHDNQGIGLYCRNVTGLTVEGNLVERNDNGIAVMTCRQGSIVANEVADNAVDGLVISHQSADLTIRQNYLHDHTRWGHPDNMQLHNTVRNLQIVDNVLLHGGQGIMMEAAEDCTIAGNLVIGTAAVALILGHGNTHRFVLRGNTVAYTGWGCVSFSGQACRLERNILCPGGPTSAFGVQTAGELVSDQNLVWRAPGLSGTLFSWGRSWQSNLADYQKVSGQDVHSQFTDPLFVNAPLCSARSENRRLPEFTTERLIVPDARQLFAVGDPVEVGFDGVRRQVTAVSDDSLNLAPPLPELAEQAPTILNWRGAAELRLDLLPRPTSPALKLAAEPLGARLDLAAYRRGDPNGDGQPEVRRRG